jgi:hypothetical protein
MGSFKIYQKSLKNEAKEFIKHFLIKAFLCKILVRYVKGGTRAWIREEIIKGCGHTKLCVPTPDYLANLFSAFKQQIS